MSPSKRRKKHFFLGQGKMSRSEKRTAKPKINMNENGDHLPILIAPKKAATTNEIKQ